MPFLYRRFVRYDLHATQRPATCQSSAQSFGEAKRGADTLPSAVNLPLQNPATMPVSPQTRPVRPLSVERFDLDRANHGVDHLLLLETHASSELPSDTPRKSVYCAIEQQQGVGQGGFNV